jgi:hypothetical protein
VVYIERLYKANRSIIFLKCIFESIGEKSVVVENTSYNDEVKEKLTASLIRPGADDTSTT